MSKNYRISDALSILAVLVAMSAMLLTGYQGYSQKDAAKQYDNQLFEEQLEDGEVLETPDALPLDNFDAVMRVRNNQGSGTGSIIAEDEMYYYVISNVHVAGFQGSSNFLDIWNNGVEYKGIKATVVESHFDENKSKDLAILRIRKSDFPGVMPVIPLAPFGNDAKLKVGDRIWQVGCDSGRWVNSERGRIVKISNGLIYYLPSSIPGNSGGPLYSADGRYQIATTAWFTTIQLDGKTTRVGLAMSSDHIRNMRAGRVADFNDTLPPNTFPVALASNTALPAGTVQVPFRGNRQQQAQSHEWRMPGSSSDCKNQNDSDQVELPINDEAEAEETTPSEKQPKYLVIWIAIAILAYYTFKRKS